MFNVVNDVKLPYKNFNAIISIGCSCPTALSLQQLKIKKETYPFDWIISNPIILYDFILNGPSKFLNFNMNNNSCNDVTFTVIHDVYSKLLGHTTSCYALNEYGIYFTHDLKDDIYEKYKRRCERFNDVIQSNSKILFIYTTEICIYHKGYRDLQDTYHDYIIKISAMYPNCTFLCINLNKVYDDVTNVFNINVTCNTNTLSDDCEHHTPEYTDNYRKIVTSILKNVLI
jgi:hypothetical protein